MHALILTSISIPAISRTIPIWSSLEQHGWTYSLNDVEKRPDAIIVMGISSLEAAYKAIHRWPLANIFVYHWDCYSWVWSNPRPGEYDYVTYGDLLRGATEVWTPSVCTSRQAMEWWDIDNLYVIHPSAPVWAHPAPADNGYILCTLRSLPDRYAGWFEEACLLEDLPFRLSDHELDYGDYQDLVAGCRFIVSHYYEASTGGLSLLEAYYHGKPVLIGDSEWNGAVEYFRDRASYYQHGSLKDFRSMLRFLYEETPVPPPDHKEWVTRNFSDERMVEKIVERLNAYP